MEIINSYHQKNYSTPHFKAGISSDLYRKLAKDSANYEKLTKKINDVYQTNSTEHVLIDATFNAKEKVADFVLDTVEKAKSIIGLENIKPRIIKSSGSSLLEAFDNIKMNSLADANKSLDKEYNDTFEATRDIREKVLASRRQTIIDIDKKSKADNTEFYKGTNYCN